jgi:hypothetical protein
MTKMRMYLLSGAAVLAVVRMFFMENPNGPRPISQSGVHNRLRARNGPARN